ncbi:MAG TPA: hypothetical protein PKO06_08495 [Candidatus Ozemobacteraceae bacterium]|nr:hypothetical protein [Candidatus Ozemobacteraceae bacterium]
MLHARTHALTLILALFTLLVAIPAWAETPFAKIDLEPRLAPEGWENARRYEIIYLDAGGEELGEADLPFYMKKQEIDLILAGVVRQILAREYETQGFKISVHQVTSSTPQEILLMAAVGSGNGKDRWAPETLTNLYQYMNNDPTHLFLYKMTAQLETEAGTVEEKLPLLLRMKQCPGQRDLISFFFVEKQQVPQETVPAPVVR